MADSIESLLRRATLVGAATAGNSANGLPPIFADDGLTGSWDTRTKPTASAWRKKPVPVPESLPYLPLNGVRFNTNGPSDSYPDYLTKTPEGRSVLLNGLGLMNRSGGNDAARNALATGLAVAGATRLVGR